MPKNTKSTKTSIRTSSKAGASAAKSKKLKITLAIAGLVIAVAGGFIIYQSFAFTYVMPVFGYSPGSSGGKRIVVRVQSDMIVNGRIGRGSAAYWTYTTRAGCKRANKTKAAIKRCTDRANSDAKTQARRAAQRIADSMATGRW